MDTLTRRGVMLLGAAAWARDPVPEIRLICAAPSPYTKRRDSFRAGAGILLCLRRLIQEHKLELSARYYDASPWLDQPKRLPGLLSGRFAVLLVGTSVWAQGPSSVSRGFFEAIDLESLAGVSASTWVTSGGAHTGGSLAFQSNLATLMALGATVFTFGQKQAVFQTGERLGPEQEGEFTLLDLWFMEGMAKASIVAALAHGNREQANQLWKRLSSSPIYFQSDFPRGEAPLRERFGDLRKLLNGAREPGSEQRRGLDALVQRLPNP
jgi:hypothetical protein